MLREKRKGRRILKGTIYEPVGEALVSLSMIIDDAKSNYIVDFYKNPVYINAKDNASKLIEELSYAKEADIERVEAYRRTYRELVDTAVCFEEKIKIHPKNVEDTTEKTPFKHSVGKRRYNPNDSYIQDSVIFEESRRLQK